MNETTTETRGGETVAQVFRSSWQNVIRQSVWLGVGVSIALVLMFWWKGDPLEDLAVFCGIVCVGSLAFFAGGYRLLGTASIEVDAEAVTVEPVGGSSVRMAWGEMREVWYRKKWHFETVERSANVRDYGFTAKEWGELSATIRALKDAGPVASLPGVLARPSQAAAKDTPVAAVFEPQYGSATWWSGPFFVVLAIGTMLASWSSYQDGTWIENPMTAVFLPLASFGFVVLVLVMLPRLVRRAAFLPDTLVIERFVGAPRTVPYEDIADILRTKVVTRRGTFILGERNSGVFLRLLEPHLEEGQLSGAMDASETVGVPFALVGILIGFVAGGVAMWVGETRYGLSGEWSLLVFVIVWFGCLGIAGLVAQVAVLRERKRRVDS